MTLYGDFARIYDRFMGDAPYGEWARLIENIWRSHNFLPEGKLVLDLGCGTGNMTLRLKEMGCDMIGLDGSEDMLAEAMLKTPDDSGILYLCQDMREFELYGTVDGITCVCDGINYLMKSADVRKVFRLVKNYLNPGGIFIFDVNTVYKYKHLLARNSFCDADEDAALMWNNYYNEETHRHEYALCFFIKNADGAYDRFDETHYQRAYSRKKMEAMISEAGLKLLGVYDESGGEPKVMSERLFFVAGNE